jgi:hypothetical protein
MNLPDLLRREYFLNRFSWHAQDYPGYVKLKRDLRREVTLTAGEIGMAAALAALGRPRALAAEYLATLGRPVPRWSSGSWWAAAGICLLVWLGGAYALGTMDALAGTGGGSVDLAVFGTPVTFTYTASEISSQFQLTWSSLAWFVAVAVVPFALGARIWRAWSPA